MLVIPGQCDYLEHLKPLTTFIRGLGNVPVRINAFHAHGVYGEAASWRSAKPEDIEPLAQALEKQKITVIRPALYL